MATNVLVRQLVDGDGAALDAELSVTLADSTGQQRIGWCVSSGEPITVYQNLDLTSDLTLAFVPQDDVAIDAAGSASYYRFRIRCDLRVESWLVQVPDSGVTQELAELIGAAAIGAGSLFAARLLPSDATDGQIAVYDVTNGWEAATASGTGDMLAATYDPQSVVGDAFARANNTGTQALATISDSGTAAAEDVGVATGDVLQLVDVGGSPGCPAVDGSNLTGIASGGVTFVSAPATPTSTGTQGNFAWGSPYLYLCVSTDVWVRWIPVRDWT